MQPKIHTASAVVYAQACALIQLITRASPGLVKHLRAVAVALFVLAVFVALILSFNLLTR
jgi:hypothetical protein